MRRVRFHFGEIHGIGSEYVVTVGIKLDVQTLPYSSIFF